MANDLVLHLDLHVFYVLQVGKEAVTYQNEIFLQSESHKEGNALERSPDLKRYLCRSCTAASLSLKES